MLRGMLQQLPIKIDRACEVAGPVAAGSLSEKIRCHDKDQRAGGSARVMVRRISSLLKPSAIGRRTPGSATTS